MQITLLAQNKSGILYKAALAFKRYQYKIVEQGQRIQINSDQILYTFTLSNKSDYSDRQGLINNLKVMPDVIDVICFEPELESEPELDSTKLLEIAQSLIDIYPNFVQAVRELDNSLEMNVASMLRLGQYVGVGLVAQGKLKQISAKNASVALKKIVLIAIQPFSIADASKDTVELYINPFCSDRDLSDRPRCYFLTGMIQGLLQSVKNLSDVTVEETTCKASGGNSCVFTVALGLKPRRCSATFS